MSNNKRKKLTLCNKGDIEEENIKVSMKLNVKDKKVEK